MADRRERPIVNIIKVIREPELSGRRKEEIDSNDNKANG
jgi:hypothetical protein